MEANSYYIKYSKINVSRLAIENFNNLNSVDILCKKCTHILPLEINFKCNYCNFNFCRECICSDSTYLNINKCIVCKSELIVNKNNSNLKSLKIICKFKNCKDELKYLELDSHERKCEYQYKQCKCGEVQGSLFVYKEHLTCDCKLLKENQQLNQLNKEKITNNKIIITMNENKIIKTESWIWLLFKKQSNVKTILSLEKFDKKLFLTGCVNGAIFLFDHEKTHSYIIQYDGHEDSVNEMRYIENGNFLSCSEDKTIKLWNIYKKQSINTFNNDTLVNCIEFNPIYNPNSFIIGDFKGRIKIYSMSSSSSPIQILTQSTRSRRILSVCSFSYNYSSYLISCEIFEKTITLWNLKLNKQIAKYEEHKDTVNILNYYKDEIFLSSSEDSTIKIWSISSGASLYTIEIQTSSSGILSFFLFSKKEILVCSHINKNVSFIDLNNYSEIYTLKASREFGVMIMCEDSNGNDIKFKLIGSNAESRKISLCSISIIQT